MRARAERVWLRGHSEIRALSFLILDQHVRVICSDRAFQAILVANFATMVVAHEAGPPDLEYVIEWNGTRDAYSLTRHGQIPLDAADPADLLFLLEKSVTVDLQKRRADLFFLHSAAIDWNGKACLLAAETGCGKSTTTWALLHHNFQYLSDELSPIDLESMRVFPYPHALCLKRPPPAYPLPAETIDLGRTLHVPVRCLPGAAITEPRPLAAVFLLSHVPTLRVPELRSIGAAEASVRLYVTALNALSHPNRGLDAVVRIAKRVPCFTVASADLAATAALIRSAVEQLSESA